MMNFIYSILWFFLSKVESLFWHIKRRTQMSQLAGCGENVWIGRNCHFTPKTVYIGNDCSIGAGAVIQSTNSKIVLGNHIMFGPEVSIHGGNHRIDIIGRYMKSIKLNEKRIGIDDADVIIEDDVWVGTRAIILKGVIIGRGSVIGAGTVVYKSIPAYSIVTSGGGVRIRNRFTEEQIVEHEKILK